MSLTTQDGNSVAVTGKTVQSVSGDVIDGKLKISVNGVTSGDIPLPESIPLRGYVSNQYNNYSIGAEYSKNPIQSWAYDSKGASSSSDGVKIGFSYTVSSKIASSDIGTPELVTEHGIMYYKYPDYAKKPTITQQTINASSTWYYSIKRIAKRDKHFYPHIIYINGKKSGTIRFKCKYSYAYTLYSQYAPDEYVYINIPISLSEMPIAMDLGSNSSISSDFYSSDPTTLMLYPVSVEVI